MVCKDRKFLWTIQINRRKINGFLVFKVKTQKAADFLKPTAGFIHFFSFLFDYSENMLNFAAEIKDHTLMTKEEFLARLDKAEKEIADGKG